MTPSTGCKEIPYLRRVCRSQILTEHSHEEAQRLLKRRAAGDISASLSLKDWHSRPWLVVAHDGVMAEGTHKSSLLAIVCAPVGMLDHAVRQSKMLPNPTIERVRDSSGNIVDVKGKIETTVDFGLAKKDHDNGVPDSPKSDAELLGHELKHDEHQFFKLPDSEEGATSEIDSILNTKVDKNLKQDADQFVDDLLKPNSQNSQQQQTPTPLPEEKKKEPQD